jgi:hypothetical protein
MAGKPGKLRRVLEWIAHFETVHSIVQAEFFRTLFWPTLATLMTGAAGILGHIPLMWILMATILAFMGASVELLAASLYIERKNPQNKLTYLGTHLNRDLHPTPVPVFGNRRQRLAQKAQGQDKQTLTDQQMMVGVRRTLDKAQIAVQVQNNATFPISVILESAETEIEGFKPPRGKFPKERTVIFPGNPPVFVSDDAIEMEEYESQRMAGKIDWVLKYGLPLTFPYLVAGGWWIEDDK